ncbi:MAG: TraX family protein, partial [Cellulosilyticaceae bacterium]
METLKKGLDGYTLKILALIFMTFDHISSFLLGAVDIPIWFNWIGRISAPIFIFMVAEGFYHTHNRKKYMLRLYLWSVGMAIGNNILNALAPHPEGIIIINNIFATMFLITVYLMGIEYLKQGIRERQG